MVSPTLADRATAWLRQRTLARPDALFARLEAALKADNPAGIIAAADAFLAALPMPHPADATAPRYRAALRAHLAACQAANQPAAALRAAHLAGAFDPNDSALLLLAGRVLAATGQPDEALIPLELAFRIRPSAPQILAALSPLLAEQAPDKFAALRQRHLEALALVQVLPTWMHGNLVVYAEGRSRAFDLDPRIGETRTIGGPLEFTPAGCYAVLPRVAGLELRIDEAVLVGADGTVAPLEPAPQGDLEPQPDGFVRISPGPDRGLDEPTVIGFRFPAAVPANPALRVRVSARPAPDVAAVQQHFGRWDHPVGHWSAP